MIRLAVVYFMVGTGFGLYMAATGNYLQMPVHAHVNLLGWLSLAVGGILYELWPAAAATRLAKAHFGLYNIGFPLMMVALFLLLRGVARAEPLVAVGATMVGAGVLSFALNVFINCSPKAARRTTSAGPA